MILGLETCDNQSDSSLVNLILLKNFQRQEIKFIAWKSSPCPSKFLRTPKNEQILPSNSTKKFNNSIVIDQKLLNCDSVGTFLTNELLISTDDIT